METVRFHTVTPFLLLSIILLFAGATHALDSHFGRGSFPSGFKFGSASAAYQYEGAAFEDGKGPSIWDNYTHQPGKILNGSNGDVAVDFYHRYKEDVKLMKLTGLNAFRMSISWPRILPKGKLSGGINKEGVAFYNNVINELLANGITPFVTLFHWDLPQALEDEYTGFLSRKIIDDFRDFVGVCFKEFGDRVKHWITINEPYIFIEGGYDGNAVGNLAPGRCSDRTRCAQGNSATEPYIAGHNVLLCHAAAVKLYRDKFKAIQKGQIGAIVVTTFMVPYSNSKLDIRATQRNFDFQFGWFTEPIARGEYPEIMRSIVGDRLPRFTKEESELLKGSYDFLGLNYYTAIYVAHLSSPNTVNISSSTDSMVQLLAEKDGVPIGKPTGNGFFSYPKGLYDLLVYIKDKYNNPTIYITENGYGSRNNGKDEIEDPWRVEFYKVHLRALLQAIDKGVKLKGFFAWSFLDNFEWSSGFTVRFGIYFVDYENGLKRIPKRSAIWFKRFLQKN
ncbi:beta-glucosidase 12-like [Dorcoceras hygrometricum]|uniref:Beta-glucosidase 12-like n=1 Tax=Dorcoceras hygrometricum TaxID=472368 RepID=A0A2Z7AE83_9LAMI|nr:beta-glucosidase 12-like [Dorcoceras hygrometricum]